MFEHFQKRWASLRLKCNADFETQSWLQMLQTYSHSHLCAVRSPLQTNALLQMLHMYGLSLP